MALAGDRRTDWRSTLHEYIPRDWVFPIVLALFVGVVVWFGRSIYDFVIPSGGTVTVPSFVGQTLEDAGSEVGRLHLQFAVISHATSNRYPKGVVVNQQPEAGSHVRQGRQVSFVVSSGMLALLMPDLRYQSMREVSLDLSRVHATLGTTTYQKSDVVPMGHVIDQDPSPLSNITPGQIVNVTISKGGAAVLRIPRFVGMSIDDARAVAAKAGIKLGQVVWTPLGFGGPPHGQVARQVPAAGAEIDPFTPVSLQVSAGPHQSGYIVRQVHLLVSVPVLQNVVPGSQLKVRLAVTDATGHYTLFDAYAQPGQKLDFTVTALGTSLVEMYVNDRKVATTVLGVAPPNAYGKPMKATLPPSVLP